MQTYSTIHNELIKHKPYLVQKYHIQYLAIFGSFSRGDNIETSDIDLLVNFTQPIGITYIDLANELEDILQIKVDLVTRNAIKAKYFEQIKNDLKYVYQE